MKTLNAQLKQALKNGFIHYYFPWMGEGEFNTLIVTEANKKQAKNLLRFSIKEYYCTSMPAQYQNETRYVILDQNEYDYFGVHFSRNEAETEFNNLINKK
jgi:hypothetical protein